MCQSEYEGGPSRSTALAEGVNVHWLEARRGAYETFEWTNLLDGQTYTVRLADDILAQSARWRVQFEFTIDLIEVL